MHSTATICTSRSDSVWAAHHPSIDDRGIFHHAEPPPAVLQPAFTHPMLAISGMAAQLNISIVSTKPDFFVGDLHSMVAGLRPRSIESKGLRIIGFAHPLQTLHQQNT